MAHPVETLNNAIVQMSWNAREGTVPNVDVRNAITQLEIAWLKWFEEVYRAGPALTAHSEQQRFARFVEWYARAYALVPAAYRAQILDPRTLDKAEAQIAQAELDRYLESASVSEAGKVSYEAVRDAAKKLAEEVAEQAKKAASGIVSAALIVGGLVLLTQLSGGRGRSHA